MITTDEIIDEIRESRLRMSQQCGHDPTKYVEYLKLFNAKYSTQVKMRLKKRHRPLPETARVK